MPNITTNHIITYTNLIELLSGEEKDDVKTVLGNNCTPPHWSKTRTDSIRYNIMRLPTAHLIAALKLKKKTLKLTVFRYQNPQYLQHGHFPFL